MALLDLHFYAETLGKCTGAMVILPEQTRSLIGSDDRAAERVKTVYLLHGLSDDYTMWCRRSSIERYAAQLGIAVVMPDGGRSWYTDMASGEQYFTFLTQELPEKCRAWFSQVSGRREDTYIAGLSMGGYGALKAAYTFPERYAAAASLSGALWVQKDDYRRRVGRACEWDAIFGKNPSLAGGREDIYALAREANPLPPTYLVCGESDGLRGCGEELAPILEERGGDFEKKVTPGAHNWAFWDREILPALRWILAR